MDNAVAVTMERSAERVFGLGIPPAPCLRGMHGIGSKPRFVPCPGRTAVQGDHLPETIRSLQEAQLCIVSYCSIMTNASPHQRLLVVAAVAVRNGRVLLTKRLPDTHLGGSWEFPGGKVEPGEQPRAALARELQEELGVKSRPGEPFAFNDHAYPDRHVLLLTYLTEITGTPRPIGCDDLRWYTADEIAVLEMPPADKPIIDKLLSLLS